MGELPLRGQCRVWLWHEEGAEGCRRRARDWQAFKQRRDYLALQVEDALTDQSVKMSEELRQALQQYLVMRKAWETRFYCKKPCT